MIGEAGIGKTRLVAELLELLGPAPAVAIGRCVSYGQGATYRPLEEVVSSLRDDLAALLAGPPRPASSSSPCAAISSTALGSARSFSFSKTFTGPKPRCST